MRAESICAVIVCVLTCPGSGPTDAGSNVTLTLVPDHSLEVSAFWEPITDTTYGLDTKYTHLRMSRPAVLRRSYPSSSFAPLLPEKPVSVSDVWPLDQDQLEHFLHQFHEGGTTRLHHAPLGIEGGYACLRAVNERFADIVFRLHGEIKLNDGKSYYTVSQFAGRVLIDRASRQIVFFRLFVPPRAANVDLNIASPEHQGMYVADIGSVPRMELVGGPPIDADRISWAAEISSQEASKLLEKKFYASSAIQWRPFDEAVAVATRSGRPLHVIVLFGPLDDESC